MWHGYAKPESADVYERMLQPELLPGLSTKPGYRGSYLLRRAVGNEVEFVTIILWNSLDDVRALTGPDYQRAVVPAERRQHLTRCDETAVHYDIVAVGPADYGSGGHKS